jgi:hypothetical protein
MFVDIHGVLMGEDSEFFERVIDKNATTFRYEVQPSLGQIGSRSVGEAKSWTKLMDILKEHRHADIVISTTDPNVPTVVEVT